VIPLVAIGEHCQAVISAVVAADDIMEATRSFVVALGVASS